MYLSRFQVSPKMDNFLKRFKKQKKWNSIITLDKENQVSQI